jgi:hypothetical protein
MRTRSNSQDATFFSLETAAKKVKHATESNSNTVTQSHVLSERQAPVVIDVTSDVSVIEDDEDSNPSKEVMKVLDGEGNIGVESLEDSINITLPSGVEHEKMNHSTLDSYLTRLHGGGGLGLESKSNVNAMPSSGTVESVDPANMQVGISGRVLEFSSNNQAKKKKLGSGTNSNSSSSSNLRKSPRAGSKSVKDARSSDSPVVGAKNSHEKVLRSGRNISSFPDLLFAPLPMNNSSNTTASFNGKEQLEAIKVANSGVDINDTGILRGSGGVAKKSELLAIPDEDARLGMDWRQTGEPFISSCGSKASPSRALSLLPEPASEVVQNRLTVIATEKSNSTDLVADIPSLNNLELGSEDELMVIDEATGKELVVTKLKRSGEFEKKVGGDIEFHDKPSMISNAASNNSCNANLGSGDISSSNNLITNKRHYPNMVNVADTTPNRAREDKTAIFSAANKRKRAASASSTSNSSSNNNNAGVGGSSSDSNLSNSIHKSNHLDLFQMPSKTANKKQKSGPSHSSSTTLNLFTQSSSSSNSSSTSSLLAASNQKKPNTTTRQQSQRKANSAYSSSNNTNSSSSSHGLMQATLPQFIAPLAQQEPRKVGGTTENGNRFLFRSLFFLHFFFRFSILFFSFSFFLSFFFFFFGSDST